MNQLKRCEACGGDLAVGLSSWHFKCERCNFEISDLVPFIDKRVESDLDETNREIALRELRRNNFRRILEWLAPERHSRGKRKLLEVGSAHGWFLEMAAGTFDVQGIEPDQVVASRTIARGVHTRVGFFPAELSEEEVFDFIIFNDVLEHIPGTVDVLKHCNRHLSENGRVIVNAPNRSGAIYRLSKLLCKLGMRGPFDRMWQVGMPSPHLYYYDTDTMEKLAAQAGLSVTAKIRIPSVVSKGLYQRVRFDGTPALKSAVLTGLVWLSQPLLSVLPADITVWSLARDLQTR